MTGFYSALFTEKAQIDQIRDTLVVLLRDGFAEDAADRLEEALAALDDLDHPIVPLCRTVGEHGIIVEGWEKIAAGLTRLYSSSKPITALGIDLSSAGECPESGGFREPYIETSFYSDEAYPFSAATRAQINEGYTGSASQWEGAFEDIDGTIATFGLAELHTALEALGDSIRSGENANGADHDAWFIGSAYMAVLLHLAVRETIMVRGLPRPMAVFVGSNESYPYFDAPVVSIDEYKLVAPVRKPALDTEDAGPAPADAGMTGLVETAPSDIDSGFENEIAFDSTGLDEAEAQVVSLNAVGEEPVAGEFASEADPLDDEVHPGASPVDGEIAPADASISLDDPDAPSAGASLRRRLSQIAEENEANEPVVEVQPPNGNLLSKLFRRRQA